jgi:hypothetical protein
MPRAAPLPLVIALRCALAFGVLALATLGADAARAQPAAAPVAVDRDAFGTLRWLEGRWRGTRPDGTPFYEGFRVVDDSTLYTFTFPDSTAETPDGSGVIALSGGLVVMERGGTRWVATEVRDGRVRFDSRAKAAASLTWDRLSADAWVATLRLPASAGGPAREEAYPMRRLPP